MLELNFQKLTVCRYYKKCLIYRFFTARPCRLVMSPLPAVQFERVSKLTALSCIIKKRPCMSSDREHAAGAGQSPSRYTCSRCHLLFSSCRLSLSRDESTSLPVLLLHHRKEETKNWLQKTLVHTQAHACYEAAIIRQKPPSCTCARGQGHPSKDSEKSLQTLWSRCLLPSPVVRPKYSYSQ